VNILETGTADVINSPKIVKTASVVTAFDDFGRVTDSIDKGDFFDANDDLCVHVDYAKPKAMPNTNVHVRNAPAVQTVQDCHGVTLAKKSFEYDGLTPTPSGDPNVPPVVEVLNGFVTSSIVTRYDLDTHKSLGDIRLFDATYDDNGNLKTITRTRDNDGATKTETIGYDPFFSLSAVSVNSAASDTNGTSILSASLAPDPLTLNVKSTTDPNGTVRSATYDGFGRVTRSKITPPGGSEGILSSTTYNGFEFGSAAGRSIEQKVFTDAVTDVTAPGRTGKTSFDSLGRAIQTEVRLGGDYQNRTVVIGQHTYDALGRVKFAADPILSTDILNAYGTTYNFNTNGTPACHIRGPGMQPYTFSVDEAREIYPTCFGFNVLNNRAIQSRTDTDALLQTSPQAGVFRETIRDAKGRVLEQRTRQPAGDETELSAEDVVFDYDPLGHRTSMKRFKDPAHQASPVTTNWHYDSLGWMTKLVEDGVAPQTRTFDSWGEVTQTQWCDDLTTAPCPTKDRSSITRFDARGRVVHREDKSAGLTVPGTVNDYSYDTGVNSVTPPVTATHTAGRLAAASWPTGTVSFSYDVFGRTKAKVFTDTTVTPNKIYVESHDVHDDGSEKTLHLLLPDNAFRDEKVDYAYDTAGRVNSAVYNDSVSSQALFAASGSTPIYDIFGRINNAQYGLARYNATFAAQGRRLLADVKVTSGAHSREISFPLLNGVAAYDPVGRERQRSELIDGLGPNSRPPTALLRSYDALGRFNTSQDLQISTNTIQPDRSFAYDPLGSILTQTDPTTGHAGSVSLSYDPSDLDRVCGIGYGLATAPQPPNPCNVTYDGAGNVVTQPTGTGTRTLGYFPNGLVSSIADGASNASFAYDAFGGLQQLTVNTPTADQRADKYFGGFTKQRIENSRSVLNRQIPAPGLVATRHGANGGWTFAFGEARGTRFTIDHTGSFLQDVDYRPFGEVKFAHGASPGSAFYTSEQWNGGDLLKALGVVNLGARVYDPVIGRFLSRDPIISAGNPYAFANNDPINYSDRTGLSADPTRGPDLDITRANDDNKPIPPASWRPEMPDIPDVPDVPDAPEQSGCNLCESAGSNAPSSLERGIGNSVFASPDMSGLPAKSPAASTSGSRSSANTRYLPCGGLQPCAGGGKTEDDGIYACVFPRAGAPCTVKGAAADVAVTALGVVTAKVGPAILGRLWKRLFGRTEGAVVGDALRDGEEDVLGGVYRTASRSPRALVIGKNGSLEYVVNGQSVGSAGRAYASSGRLSLELVGVPDGEMRNFVPKLLEDFAEESGGPITEVFLLSPKNPALLKEFENSGFLVLNLPNGGVTIKKPSF
jgi:RHS repeat-associated core domain